METVISATPAPKAHSEEKDLSPPAKNETTLSLNESLQALLSVEAKPVEAADAIGAAPRPDAGVVKASASVKAAIPPPAAPENMRRISGYFDGVIDGRASGWAYDELQPKERLQVEIWAGDEFVAFGEASRLREDLVRAKKSDGHCHFSIALPRIPAQNDSITLHALISGASHILEGRATVDAPAPRITASIDVFEGLTVKGWVRSESGSWFTVDIFCDGVKFGSSEIPPLTQDQTYPIAWSLPISQADGNVHWLQLLSPQSGALVAQTVIVAPIVATPEDALQKYAKNFPAFMSSNASNRYLSLIDQIKIFRETLEKQDQDENSLSTDQYFKQIEIVHNQVAIGIKEQNKTPETLHFLQYARPDVSIVVPVHNKFWVTYNCLAALLLAPNRHTFEVILVDDGSSDQTKDLAKYATGIQILRNETAEGFVKSSNRGGSHARGDYVVMLNNDTEPCAYWLDELIHVFDNFKDVGLVGSKFVYPNGVLQEAGGIIFPNLAAWNYGRNGNPAEPRYNYTRQADYVSGACIMLRRELWNELKGFDEYFAPAYYEDTDLAFRVRRQGLKTYYAPFSKIIHFEGVSSGTSLTSGVKRFQKVNEPKFRGRWANVLRAYPSTLNPDLAKDRGIAMRCLVLDAQPPQPDRDAGGYAAVQEMRLLAEMGMKLTFVPLNLAYLGNYTEDLQRRGVECLYAPFQTSVDDILEARGAEFDLFYITRYSVAQNYLATLRRVAPHAKIIFNNADLHFLREIRAAIASKSPEAIQAATRTRDEELRVMRETDVTLSYTETEAAVIMSHNLDSTKVARCPWVVDVASTVKPFASRSGLAFLGSYQHPPNAEAVQFFIREVLPALRQRIPDLEFKIYGSNMPPEFQKLAGGGVSVMGYVDDVAEVYENCRIFIAPLLSGAGIKGKVIGSLAAGAPTIMTSLAAEGIAVSRGVDAIVADGVPEWVEAVVSLYLNEAKWTAMSNSALAFARRNFSFEGGLATMKAALAAAGVYV